MSGGMVARVGNSLLRMGWTAGVLLVLSILLLPLVWLYSRLFPRVPSKVLFWTNQGFVVAPARVRSYFFCREMQRQGVDACVLSFYDHLLKLNGLPPFQISHAKKLWTLMRATIAAIHSKAGIIIVQTPDLEVIPFSFLKLMYPFSLHCWTDFDDWTFNESFGQASSTIQIRNLLKLYSYLCTGTFVSSCHLYEELKKYYSTVELIPTFPDTSLFVYHESPMSAAMKDHIIFSWIGTFYHEINIHDLIFMLEAVAPIVNAGIFFHIVGGGPLLDTAKSQVQLLGLGDQVQFVGWKDPELIPQIMTQIDIGLYCLTRHTDYTLSKSPTKLFEYMACGKPTVSTWFGEAARFIEHGITGYLARTQDEFTQYCSILAKDPELRVRIGRNARARIDGEYNLSCAMRKVRQTLRL